MYFFKYFFSNYLELIKKICIFVKNVNYDGRVENNRGLSRLHD